MFTEKSIQMYSSSAFKTVEMSVEDHKLLKQPFNKIHAPILKEHTENCMCHNK